MNLESARLEYKEMNVGGDSGYPFQNAVEPDGEERSRRQRQQTATSDDEHRLTEHVGDDAPSGKTQCAQSRYLSEALIDRDRQEDRNKQHRKRQSYRRQYRRNLAEVGEATAFEPIYGFGVA